MVKERLRAPLRSLLVIPSLDAVAAETEPDAVVIDAAIVAPSARALPRTGGPALFLRVGDSFDAELDAAMPAGPYGVALRNAVSAEQIQQLSVKLSVREARLGIADGTTLILAMAGGSAASLPHLSRLAGASRRVAALGWDGANLPGETGTSNVAMVVRSLVVCAAHAAGLPAIDGRSGLQARLDDFGQRCEASRRNGFTGMLTHDPSRVATIHKVFGSSRIRAPEDASERPPNEKGPPRKAAQV